MAEKYECFGCEEIFESEEDDLEWITTFWGTLEEPPEKEIVCKRCIELYNDTQEPESFDEWFEAEPEKD